MNEVTIDPTYVIAVLYAAIKVGTSIWVCKREFQYPIWNRDGIQIPRGVHHKIQSFGRNWLVNPEWGLLKAIAFAPVFLVTGRRHIHAFLPWKIQKTPPICRRCNDKGQIFVKPFVSGTGNEKDGSVKRGKKRGVWQICDCQDEREDVPCACGSECHVCLDSGTIGKNRPCPHCERRGKSALERGSAARQVTPADLEELVGCRETLRCGGCGDERLVSQMSREMTVTDWMWFCPECLVKYRRYITSRSSQRYRHSPLSYLQTNEMCGNPNNHLECSDWKDNPRLRRKNPTELHVGDTIIIRSAQVGHRSLARLGKPLRILGLNLPFAAVESPSFSKYSRHVIDLRGLALYGSRDTSPVKSTQTYQPLLEPTALKVGDTFMMLQLQEKGSDGSYRGEAFRVTRAAHEAGLTSRHSGTQVIEAEHLSFTRSFPPATFCCVGLLITPVNDQYIQATVS